MQLDTIESAIAAIANGELVVVVDDTDRENEGDLIMAASKASPEKIAFMIRHTSGILCVPMTAERADQLNLAPMVANNIDPLRTAFTVSVDYKVGMTTGISATERTATITALANGNVTGTDFIRPGHIFPLAAMPGGVLTRAGHTEAASDYARLAGLLPAAVIADILTPEGMVADGPALREFADRHQLKIGTIADLIHFRLANERTIRRIREGVVQTGYGEFKLTAYRDQTAGEVHLALSRGDIVPEQPTLVRVHVQSAMRDLVSTRIEGPQGWNMANCLKAVAESDRGVIVLLVRSESPEQLLSSVDLALGKTPAPGIMTPDSYTTVGLGSQILKDLGVGKIHLMGAPIKYNAISGFGLEVLDFVQPGQ